MHGLNAPMGAGRKTSRARVYDLGKHACVYCCVCTEESSASVPLLTAPLTISMQISKGAVQLLSLHPQRVALCRCSAQQGGTQAGPLFLLRRRVVQVHAATAQLCESAAKEGLRERLELSFQLADPVASLPLRELPGSALLSVELEPPRQTGGPKRDRSEDFYANVGSAIRTLRDETPLLFQRDLSCVQPVLACEAVQACLESIFAVGGASCVYFFKRARTCCEALCDDRSA